jgi:hypothetical protein
MMIYSFTAQHNKWATFIITKLPGSQACLILSLRLVWMSQKSSQNPKAAAKSTGKITAMAGWAIESPDAVPTGVFG